MRSTGRRFLVLFVLLSGVGCQCSGLTDRYADNIDDLTDQKISLDRLYRADLDLNRIGHSDWYANRFNRKLCPRCQKYHE